MPTAQYKPASKVRKLNTYGTKYMLRYLCTTARSTQLKQHGVWSKCLYFHRVLNH